jgi:predicted permease
MKDDLRQAIRALRKQPGFAAVAVLTLTFGIGVNVSLFSLVSAFFLQPLPVKDAHQLVLLMQRGEAIGLPYGHSFPDYLDYREGTSAFSELVAYMPTPVHLAAPGETPERTWIEVVSPNYFALADVKAGVGDLFHPGQGESKGAAPDVVLGHRYWQRRFGGDPGIVGRTVTLNGRGFTVIGVTPASFSGLSWAMAVSAFVPSGAAPALMEGGEELLTNRGAPAWRIMGRLRPGKTFAEARAEVEGVARRLAADHPNEHKSAKALLIPENRARPDPSVAEFLPIFAAVFSGMVGLVLFIACANVANLMLSRSLVRTRELVIRSAIGASRFRLVRLQVVESLVLALLAGALALIVARWTGEALAGFTPAGDIPVNTDHPWDWRVYAFTFLVSIVAGVGTGLWPALKASRAELTQVLKEGGGRVSPGRHRLRNALVMGQVTLSLVVLISAGLFVHSLQELGALPLGFRSEGLLMASLDLGLQRYGDERGRQFVERLVERTEALPGVSSASLTLHVPLDYGIQISEVAIDGEIPGSKDGYASNAYSVVGPRFFETAGVGLLRGRAFERNDDQASRPVAVVNGVMARTLWPGQDAVGKRFRFGRNGDWTSVVGVAADGKYVMLAEEPRAYFYLPLAQRYRSPITLLVRSASSDPSALVKPLQDLLHELDSDLPIFNVRTMERHVRESAFGLMPLRMGATLAAIQGLVGLFLAVMGLYAVVSYAVAQRRHEIGVRMALGAQAADVLRLVVREGMRLTSIGVAIGLLVALGVGFGLSRVLYGVKAVDAGVIVGVTMLLVGVTGLACYLPARRATRVDPIVALRYE